MNLLFLLAVGILLLLLAKIFFQADRDIYRTFDLSPRRCQLVSSDLGGREARYKFSYLSVRGICDAIFISRDNSEVFACEYKGRAYKRKLRLYEYYQLQLYIGLSAQRFKCHARGLIAYSCGRVIEVEFNIKVFNALIALRDEAELVKKQLRRAKKTTSALAKGLGNPPLRGYSKNAIELTINNVTINLYFGLAAKCI